MGSLRTFGWLFVFSLIFLGCPSGQKNASSDPSSNDGDALIKKGRSVYVAQCTACHNTDPSKDGAIGPSVAGSTLELLEARILRAEYPATYSPKRKTKQMAPLPHLKADLPAIYAYLQSIHP